MNVCTVHLRIYGSTCALRSVCSILTLKIKRKRKREKSKILRQYTVASFICPAKSNFFVRLQIFLHANWNFLHPQELALHAKNDVCGYCCLQILSKNHHNWHFWEIFVLIPKNNSSQSCIKCIFAAWKKSYAACTNKTSPWWKFSTAS